MADYTLDPARCALIVQDLQNDVIIDGGAFAESGSPQHAKDQNVVENVKDLAAFCRGKGIPVIHVWYIVDEGAPGLKVNAPLFEGVAGGALVRGTWGAAPVDGLEAQDGDYVVEKMRMSGVAGDSPREPPRGPRHGHDHRHGRLDEHVDRAHLEDRRRQGLLHGRPRGRLLDDERRLAQRVDQLRAPERLDRDDVRGRQGGARRVTARPRVASRSSLLVLGCRQVAGQRLW